MATATGQGLAAYGNYGATPDAEGDLMARRMFPYAFLFGAHQPQGLADGGVADSNAAVLAEMRRQAALGGSDAAGYYSGYYDAGGGLADAAGTAMASQPEAQDTASSAAPAASMAQAPAAAGPSDTSLALNATKLGAKAINSSLPGMSDIAGTAIPGTGGSIIAADASQAPAIMAGGANGMVAEGAADALGSTTAATTVGEAAGAAGYAAGGFGLGTMAGSLIHPGHETGSMVGAAAGTLGGGLGSVALGLEAGSILGPIGALAGGLIGGIAGSFFGPGKPHHGWGVDVGSDNGQLTTTRSAFDKFDGKGIVSGLAGQEADINKYASDNQLKVGLAPNAAKIALGGNNANPLPTDFSDPTAFGQLRFTGNDAVNDKSFGNFTDLMNAVHPGSGNPQAAPAAVATPAAVAAAPVNPNAQTALANTAMSNKAFASGGAVDRQRDFLRGSGLIRGDSAGRSDRIAMHLPRDSYVLPADVVSAMGQGNTDAGAKHIAGHLRGIGGHAAGGRVEPVPVNVSGGEFAVHPRHVAALGGGNLAAGHARLDQLVQATRARAAHALQTMPPPK